MKKVKKMENKHSKSLSYKNPIMQMIDDKKRIMNAIKNGKKLSSIKGVKFVSSL